MPRKRVVVTQKSDTGRNQKYHDTFSNMDMTRAQFVKKIEQGDYQNYHVRNINGVKTPVSNPDSSKKNNLD